MFLNIKLELLKPKPPREVSGGALDLFSVGREMDFSLEGIGRGVCGRRNRN